jgi:LPS export ABC transporter protein LptC
MLAIVSCVVFFNIANNVKSSPFTTTKQAQEYMKNVHVTHYAENGSIKDDITATSWEYHPNVEQSKLVNPVLYINKLNGITWRIEAKYGMAMHKTLESKILQLNLWDDVIARRPATITAEPITVSGRILHYFPETEYITSDEYVKMEKPGLTITGTGFHGYLNKNWVEILNNVTTQYINQKS